ncbi:unnamed protein product [Auanema sp. JU1783]|nr:unnamed protein product [Auanema sp. JU1783]
MQLLLSLTDHEDIEHKKVEIELDEDSTLRQLKQEISSKLHIDPVNQNIFFHDGREICGIDFDSTLQQIGFRHLDKLIVKHSDVSWWPEYKEYVEIAMKGGPRRMQTCKEAVRLHADLMDNGFFYAYSRFNTYRMENHYKVASWTDDDTKLMREATLSHFRAIHFKRGANDELDFVCRFEPRPGELGGSRKNTLAYVRLHGEQDETKYNVKCHHFGSSSSSAKGQSPDIKEFYCYKLLELLNVGPQVHFILPNILTGSRTSMYIATRWCDDFVPITSIKKEDVSVESLAQILLLGTFLFMDDLHSDNCGQWKGTKNAAIVDFMPRAYTTFTNVKKALLNNDASVYWDEFHIDALEKCNEESRLEMARASLMKWDLLSKIDLANELITPEKDRMKRQDIGFKGFNSPTEELDLYITATRRQQGEALKTFRDENPQAARALEALVRPQRPPRGGRPGGRGRPEGGKGRPFEPMTFESEDEQ